MSPENFVGQGLPVDSTLPTVLTGLHFEALENFFKTFAVRPDDRMVFLADRKLDPLVISAICGVARARGVTPWVIVSDTTQHAAIPDEVRPILANATFVVSTWFCSILDPFCIALRKQGQRWVKITYFRDIKLLDTPQARFPIEIVGELIRQTASLYPRGQNFDLKFTDSRGSDFSIPFSAAMRDAQLSSNRWRGRMTPDEPGSYIHYLPTHGPNLYDRTSIKDDPNVVVEMSGVVFPTWAVGFAKLFSSKIGVRFASDRIISVDGTGEEAEILRDMLVGGQLIELGCGFNPKAPRKVIYPAGSNSPGALHFGIDLAKPCDYIRKVMPEWEEPPIHMDLISFDMTVTAGQAKLIDGGFLSALRAPSVVEMAAHYGDPVDLLEAWPDN